jgi:hypothetical protein
MVKSMPFLGGSRLWSNRYFFTGTDPTDAQFSALATLLKNQEKGIYSSRVTINEAVGYHAGSDVPVWSETLSQAGTFSPATGRVTCPGDCAVFIRMNTDQRTSKNHPIYLFKYYHDVHAQGNSQPDNICDDQNALYADVATSLHGTWNDGTSDRQICGPYGAVALGATVGTYITHRDFPR